MKHTANIAPDARRTLLGRIDLPHPAVIVVAALLMSCHVFYCCSLNGSKSVLIFGVLGVLAFIGLYAASVFVFERLEFKEALFTVSLVFLGLLFCAVFPPHTVPDELVHFRSAYVYSNGLAAIGNPMIDVRAEDAAVLMHYAHTTLDWEAYQNVARDFHWLVGDSSIQQVTGGSSVNGYPPQTRIAPALGIALAKLLHLGALPLFYLGRLFNFALFVVLAVFAVRNTPVGKNIMIAICLLPMTLHVAASYSYDGATLGFALMLTSLLLKALYSNEPCSVRLLVGIAAFTVLLAPCKVIYSFIVLLVFLIPAKNFSNKKLAWGFKLGLPLLALLSIAAVQLPSLINMAMPAEATDAAAAATTQAALDKRPDGTTGHFYDLSDLLADPWGTIILFLHTFDFRSDMYLASMVGGQLGWLQPTIFAPDYLYFTLLLVLLISSLPSPEDKTIPSPAQRTVFLVAFFAATLCSVLSMAIAHTFDFETFVQGVQGRYFLPVLPLLLLGLRFRGIRAHFDMKPWLILFLVWFNLVYLLRVYTIALGL